MRTKILKAQSLILFTLALPCTVYFFYHRELPDHYLKISSSSQYDNFLFYYGTSVISFCHYYVGVWVVAPFLIFMLSYALFFAKRAHNSDIFLFVPIVVCPFLATTLMAPRFMGLGPLNWANQYLATSFGWILLGLFLGFGIYGLLREKLALIFKKTKGLMTKTISLLAQAFQLAKKWKGRRLQDGPDNNRPEPPQEIDFESIVLSKRDKAMADIEVIEEKGPLVKTKNPAKSLRQKMLPVSSRDLIETLKIKGSGRRMNMPDESYFNDIVGRIEDKLNEFKIQCRVINVMKGPVVDTFELELGPGVKVSRVNSITEDLGLALCGVPIRLVYPMEGKSTLGLEVPRNPREIIYLDEVLADSKFLKNKHNLPICMGKDAYGETFVADLTSMPHMLIAGATGAGKSVFLNAVLVSLLIKKKPDQMKLILIDPKQLELAVYADCPHLALPVITEGKKAQMALLWACQEMDRRYSILKAFGVRNISSYNEKVKVAAPEKLERITSYFAEEKGYELPYIVIIIDEFADLILTKVGKEIENNVCRLAAKARAAGIHLILATQRPSVDVITGLIKSNFPTRVSFKVTTNIDSRTILSAQGAEKLLGMGDMLYKHNVEMKRVHSAFVEEEEIESLMQKLAPLAPHFMPDALDFIENQEVTTNLDDYAYNPAMLESESGGDDNSLYQQAITVVAEHQKASASFLQRRLGIGYNRAANLIEKMEEKGLVGPAQGAKAREIFLDPPLK